jgi:two-component system, NarL family, response regulator DegU
MDISNGTRILLADDHPMLREGLHRSLQAKGYQIVGEAADGQKAVELAESADPQIILMDLTMPVLDGLEATRRIIARMPGIRVVILTMHAEPQLAKDAVDAGASGYLVKDCTTDDIVDAIEAALRGETTFPTSTSSAATSSQRPVITQREAEVLQLIADGNNTTEAAKALYVSVKTVKNHLASAYAKLDAHDRTQAVLRAARLGLIKLDNG